MILYLNCNKDPASKSYTKADYLLDAAGVLGIRYHKDRVDVNDKNIFLIKSYKGEPNPQYILNIEPYHKFIKGVKWTGVWEIDMTFDREQMNLSNWIASDMVFVANSNLPDRMKAYQGPKTILFQACDPFIHRRIPKIEPEYDFVFSGTINLDIYHERSRVINLLRKWGYSFMDYGKGYTPQEYVEKLNIGRVQVIISAGKPPIANSQVEQRFFESLAIGPVLKDYHPDLEELGLVESRDFFWYKNDSELALKMRYLIANPKFASDMASHGRYKAIGYHSYGHRLLTILNYIQEHQLDKKNA